MFIFDLFLLARSQQNKVLPDHGQLQGFFFIKNHESSSKIMNSH